MHMYYSALAKWNLLCSWWLSEKPVLNSLYYGGTSCLAKTLMSLSRCFCFHVHKRNDESIPFHRRSSSSIYTVYFTDPFAASVLKENHKLSYGTWRTMVLSLNTRVLTANGSRSSSRLGRGLILEVKCTCLQLNIGAYFHEDTVNIERYYIHARDAELARVIELITSQEAFTQQLRNQLRVSQLWEV